MEESIEVREDGMKATKKAEEKERDSIGGGGLPG